jgi:hypothetical protein
MCIEMQRKSHFVKNSTHEFTKTVHLVLNAARSCCLVTCLMCVPYSLGGAALVGATVEEDIARYRQGWNPLTAGPQLVSSADVMSPGQFFLRVYSYNEIGYGQFGNTWSGASRSLPRSLAATNPQLELSYGITNSFEFELYVTELAFWASGNNQPTQSRYGLGDTTMFVKYRTLIQQPDSWQPTLTPTFYVTLPTSDWAGTPKIPGGFAPLGRLPATHAGAPEFTPALLLRKNLRPFRLSGGVFYSYGPPSTSNGTPQYFSDIVQYRLALEHIVDDRTGFGYALEFLGLHGVPWRLDGHQINATPKTFGLLGVQPTVQYNLTERLVAAVGVLFTVGGQNDIGAIYPNFSVYYYFPKDTRVIPR